VNHFSFSSLSNSCQLPYQFCSARTFLHQVCNISTKSLKDSYRGQDISSSTVCVLDKRSSRDTE